jgi:ELWxxDGT repeat protein
MITVAAVLFVSIASAQSDPYLVKDIDDAPTAGSYPHAMTILGDRVYFVAAGALWSTDGTPGGTGLVTALPGDAELAAVDDRLYVRTGPAAGSGPLYALDDEGMLTPISTTSRGVERLIPAGENLFFRGFNSLCVLGANGGEVCLQRIFYQQEETLAGGLLFFVGRPEPIGSPPQLWVSDGTPDGTHPLDVDGADDFWGLSAVGETLYFVGRHESHGQGLWASDGTDAGTRLVTPLISAEQAAAGVGILEVAAARGQLFLAIRYPGRCELWGSDGTALGTRLVKRFSEEPSIGINNEWCYVRQSLFGSEEKLFFSRSDADHGWEPWVSDGTEAGTRLIKDINPGSGDSYPQPLAAVDGRTVFSACNDEAGCEFWISDGTASGTYRNDIATGASSSLPNWPPELHGLGGCAPLGSVLLCSANDQLHGVELWAIPLINSARCVGDCNGDRRVAIDELVRGVSIALGGLPAGACVEVDINASGDVTINELIAAVRDALNGCDSV